MVIDFIDLSFVLTNAAQYTSLVLFLFGFLLAAKSDLAGLKIFGVLSIIVSAAIIILRLLAANGVIII